MVIIFNRLLNEVCIPTQVRGNTLNSLVLRIIIKNYKNQVLLVHL